MRNGREAFGIQVQKGCASRSRLAGFVHKHDVGPGNLGALRTREARAMEHYKQSRRQLELVWKCSTGTLEKDRASYYGVIITT